MSTKPSRSVLKKIPPLLLVLLTTSILVCRAEQSHPGGRLCHYKITSRGFSVGKLKTTISPVQQAGGQAVRFQSDLAIDADLLLFKITKTNREEAIVSDHGTLSYHRNGQENGRSSTVDADLEGGAFRFRMAENGVIQTVTVPKTSYDFTTMDCPEITMQREGEAMEIRLLDMEHAKVVLRRFHWVKTEEMEVGGKRLRCRVVDFTDLNNSCRRWISNDARGVIIVRQDGKGKGGNYSLRMVSLENAPA